jgi:DNA-binding NarL/FixJ family response regulator
LAVERPGAEPRSAAAAAGRRLRVRVVHVDRQILDALADGLTNADIGALLGLRESTVKTYVSRILTELGVTNRVQAAIVARDLR